MSHIPSALNQSQEQAVAWGDGPLLVLAGPGSGKTRVLTARVCRLISEAPADNFRILALTFTNKAAAEMRERVEALVGEGKQRALLTTFHSFAGDVLRQHGHLIGLKPDFTILTSDEERASILDEVIAEVYSDEYDPPSGGKLLPVINRLLDQAAGEDTAVDILRTLQTPDIDRTKRLYFGYREALIARNSLDFSCLIAETIKLLATRSAVRRQIHQVYSYVCIDEFQDTNLSQYKLLRLIVPDSSPNLFVVADDDQIIYQWNGASPDRLKEIVSDFAMPVIQLPENYRCPPEVIELANLLIAHNPERTIGKQPLRARKSARRSDAIRLNRFSTFEDEVAWVANDIAQKALEDRKKCVVLARARKPLETAIEALERRGVSAYLAMRKDEFVSAPMRWLHATLRLANARQDREQLRRLTKAFYSLEGINIKPDDVVSAAALREGDYLRSFIELALARAELVSSTREFFSSDLRGLCDKLEYQRFIEAAFEWVDSVLPEEDSEGHFIDYNAERETWNDLTQEIYGQYGIENATLNVVLQELDLRSKAPRPPVGALPCFTIHASKGLEFDHVYLVGMVEDQLPSWGALKKGANSLEIQEERRNCFVAITRTQETLSLSYSDVFQGWRKAPSRFLREMGLLA